MKSIVYHDWEIQKYLIDKDLTTESKKRIFRWRIHSEIGFGENFRGSRSEVSCPLCLCHRDSQFLSFTSCQVIRREIEVRGNYTDIFESNAHTKDLVSTLDNISKTRERLLCRNKK